MRRLRLDRWGAQCLSPSSRGPYRHLLQPHNHRPQSTRASQFSSSPSLLDKESSLSVLPAKTSKSKSTTESSQRLEDLPSPPISEAKNSPKLSALHARLSLPSRLPIQTLARTLVDRTADPDPRFNNSSLALLGSSILGYYTSEYLICHYPRLPMDVLFAAMAAYVGPKALAAITREWGVDFAAEPGGEVDPGLLQFRRTPPGVNPHETASMQGTGRNDQGMHWRRGLSSRIVYDDEFGNLRHANIASSSSSPTSSSPTTTTAAAATSTSANPDFENSQVPCTTAEDASTQFVRALLAAIHMHAGRHCVKRFYTQHFLSRTLDLASIFDFKYPTRDLSRLCLREGFEAPVARLISETGRLSRHPVFVVGVYSGRDKLGEGVGASLDEARVRASAAALKGWYLYSPMDVVVPSEVEYEEGKGKWRPNMVDCGEIVT